MAKHNTLVLYPNDPQWAPADIGLVVTALRDIGLAGEILNPEHAHQYFVGNQFLSLVSFLGCSPNIEVAPVHNKPETEFCFLRFYGPCHSPQFLFGSNRKPGRCPQCRNPLVTTDAPVGDLVTDEAVHCALCGKDWNLNEIDWRQSAALLRFGVVLAGIHEGEAVPGDKCLSTMAALSGCEWRYCYVCGDDRLFAGSSE